MILPDQELWNQEEIVYKEKNAKHKKREGKSNSTEVSIFILINPSCWMYNPVPVEENKGKKSYGYYGNHFDFCDLLQ